MPGGNRPGVSFSSSILASTSFRVGSDSAPLRKQTSPWTTSSSSTQIAVAVCVEDEASVVVACRPAEADLAQPGLVADDDPLFESSSSGLERAPFDDVVDADRQVVGVDRTIWRICRKRRCSFLAEVFGQPRRPVHFQDVLHRIAAAADQAQARARPPPSRPGPGSRR